MLPPASQEKPLGTGDVARLLHGTTVGGLRWIRAGKLKGCRVPGGHDRIARAEFRKFLADNRMPVTLDAPPRRRILVVDDEEPVCEALQLALEARGDDVVLAKDGREALCIVRQESFDRICLDSLLPGLAGASVLETSKRRDPEALVVLITGYAQHEKTLAALEHGPAMSLPKPIKLEDLHPILKVEFNE